MTWLRLHLLDIFVIYIRLLVFRPFNKKWGKCYLKVVTHVFHSGDVRRRQTLGRLRSINPNMINHHQNLQNDPPPPLCFCRAKQISQWESLINHKFGDSSLNGWKVILRQTQKGVNFYMKLNGQSTLTIMEILTTPGTNLVIIAWRVTSYHAD